MKGIAYQSSSRGAAGGRVPPETSVRKTNHRQTRNNDQIHTLCSVFRKHVIVAFGTVFGFWIRPTGSNPDARPLWAQSTSAVLVNNRNIGPRCRPRPAPRQGLAREPRDFAKCAQAVRAANSRKASPLSERTSSLGAAVRLGEPCESRRGTASKLCLAFHHVPVIDLDRAQLPCRLPDCVTRWVNYLRGETIYLHLHTRKNSHSKPPGVRIDRLRLQQHFFISGWVEFGLGD